MPHDFLCTGALAALPNVGSEWGHIGDSFAILGQMMRNESRWTNPHTQNNWAKSMGFLPHGFTGGKQESVEVYRWSEFLLYWSWEKLHLILLYSYLIYGYSEITLINDEWLNATLFKKFNTSALRGAEKESQSRLKGHSKILFVT